MFENGRQLYEAFLTIFKRKYILRRVFEGPNAEVPRGLHVILRNVNFTRVKRSRNLERNT